MRTTHAPNRCDARAVRIAQVKFMALPMEELDPGLRRGDAAPAAHLAVAPAEAGAQSRSGNNSASGLFTALVASLIRVIGRLEAARP